MKLDESLNGLEWERAFTIILSQKRDELGTLIVRTDELKKVYEMRDYLTRQAEWTYIKLGVACSMNKLYQVISDQVGCDISSQLIAGQYRSFIPIIANKIKEKQMYLTIVVDNCQYFAFDQIFALIGLMLELTGFARFIFLLPEDYLERWSRKHSEFGFELFMKLISAQYDLT